MHAASPCGLLKPGDVFDIARPPRCAGPPTRTGLLALGSRPDAIGPTRDARHRRRRLRGPEVQTRRYGVYVRDQAIEFARIELFYRHHRPLITQEDVLVLNLAPDVVIYQ